MEDKLISNENKKLKVALCLKGVVGRITNHNSDGTIKGIYHDFNLSLKGYFYWKKNLLDHNNVDVFIHCWDKKYKDNLISMYNPKDYLFEDQIDFGKNLNKDWSYNRLFSSKSNWYSCKTSIDIMRNYEKKFNIKYDIVILSRFDVAILKPIKFSQESLDLNNYLFHNGTKPIHKFRKEEDRICSTRGCCDINSDKYEIGDLMFFSSSDNMYNFSRIYDDINNYYNYNQMNSNHVIAYQKAKQLGLKLDSLLCTKRYNKYNGPEDGDITLVRWMNK